MSDCCDPVPYRRFFNRREASRRLRNYRRRGLDAMASGMVEYITGRGVAGRSILEIGGGVGDLQVELLKAGAANAVNVELSAGYEEAAAELMHSEGMTGRSRREIGDFVARQDLVESADIVVLNRVVCCYPWMDQMMTAAVSKTGWLLGIAVPRDRAMSRVFVGVGNWLNRVRSCGFQAFVHPIGDMERLAERGGLEIVYRDRDLFWEAMVFESRAA
ncbi:MAG: SAM-dependent methyltransferase [Acidimicrobiia bacterium]|jgi:magnesium-protoporphyrin O-methyltransferase